MRWAVKAKPEAWREEMANIHKPLRPLGMHVGGDSRRWAALGATFWRGDLRQATAIFSASEQAGNAEHQVMQSARSSP